MEAPTPTPATLTPTSEEHSRGRGVQGADAAAEEGEGWGARSADGTVGVYWGDRPRGWPQAKPTRRRGGHSLVALLIVCAVHPFPGAVAISEAYPGIEGVCVLDNELLENRWGGRFWCPEGPCRQQLRPPPPPPRRAPSVPTSQHDYPGFFFWNRSYRSVDLCRATARAQCFILFDPSRTL